MADGETAAFDLPADALLASIDLQRSGGATSRVAIHTSVEPTARCEHLRAIAHPGQILVTGATVEALSGRLPEGVTLDDLGPRRLRDLSRPEHVYQLRHPDLPSEFPPPRSLDTLPNNLPVQLSSFVGRASEIARVRALLTETRMLTVTGAGGCGKSRLAVHAGAESADDYADGVWWVDLAPLGEPALLAATIAAALGIREPPGARDLVEVIRGRLREKDLLLIVDNCEHLVGPSVELVEALLHGCPRLVVLATSREPLGAEGEVTYRTPSLGVPVDAADLERSEAVTLFDDRARQARADFRNTDGSSVAEICRRLDGIPLAIELAAARVSTLSTRQILDGLADRFGFLTGGRRTALPRQRTLQASVDWSHELLDAEDRTLLRRLAVFSGSFALEAVERICSGAGVERRDVVGLLSRLVDRSLVQPEETGGAVRYRLLETIRHYASEKLADSGEGTEFRHRHLEFFVEFGEEADLGIRGAEQLEWLARVDLELPNLRAAAEWAAFSGRSQGEARLAASLWLVFIIRSYLSDLRIRITDRLPPPEEAEPRVRAELYVATGWQAMYAGDLTAGVPASSEALAIGRATSDPRIVATASHSLGWLFFMEGEEVARAHFERAIIDSRTVGDPFFLGLSLAGLGYTQFTSGETAAARETLDEALAWGRRLGNLYVIQQTLAYIGHLNSSTGDFPGARAAFEEGIRGARDLGDVYFLAVHSGFLAEALTSYGDLDAGRRAVEEAIRYAREAESRFATAMGLSMRGLMEAHSGDLEAAMRWLEEALALGEVVTTYRWLTPRWLAIQGAVELLRGDFDAAAARTSEAVDVALGTGNVPQLAPALLAQSLVARVRGEWGPAEAAAHEALKLAMGSELAPAAIDSLEALAGAAAARARHVEAARLLAAAETGRRCTSYVRSPMLWTAHDGDVRTAREGLGEEAFEAATREGATMSLEEAAAYAAKGRGARGRPTIGWASLTPVELDVVRFASQGLTNPQIAEKLFISPRTVQSHLRRIFRKLDITSRAELAAEFVRRSP